MLKRVVFLFLLAILFQANSCKNSSENKVLTKEITFTKEGEVTIKKATNDSIVTVLDIEIAESEYETQTGLMYRKEMEKNQGMLFIFEREEIKSFYMKNTQFPLDIIYINSDLKVINIHKNAVPFDKTSLPSDLPAKYVLEINGGLSDLWGLTKGDKIEYQRTTK